MQRVGFRTRAYCFWGYTNGMGKPHSFILVELLVREGLVHPAQVVPIGSAELFHPPAIYFQSILQMSS
jgi:hypothetical protein